MRRIMLAAIGVVLFGCVSQGRLGTLPNSAPDAAEIVVIRPVGFVGCASPIPVTVDGQDAYGLACGDHVVLTVPAGERLIGVKTRRWFVEDESTTALTAAPRTRYYLRIDVSVASGPVLHRITEETGRQLMAKTTLLR